MTTGRHTTYPNRRYLAKLISVFVAGSASGASLILAIERGPVLYLAAAILACVLTMLAATA